MDSSVSKLNQREDDASRAPAAAKERAGWDTVLRRLDRLDSGPDHQSRNTDFFHKKGSQPLQATVPASGQNDRTRFVAIGGSGPLLQFETLDEAFNFLKNGGIDGARIMPINLKD